MRFARTDEDAFRERRQWLVDDYAAWLPEPVSTGVDPHDFGMLLEWKWSAGDGDLARWSREELEEFLFDWCPRQLHVPADRVRVVPIAVAMGMSYLADRSLLHPDSDVVDDLVECAANGIDDFEQAMSDPSGSGMTKSILTAMGVDDETVLDEARLQQVMDDFNALPYDERKAITDPSMSDEGPPSLGPVRMPSRAAVEESAAAAPVLAAFGTIADYLAAPGKVLTAKGNLKLADAQALADLLGTGESVEDDIGGQMFQKKSSTQFVVLDHLQWWAREVGAVRRRTNRLVGVKAWQERVRKDPVRELTAAFDVLLDYGCLVSLTGYPGRLDEWLDTAVPGMLARLLAAGAPTEYAEVHDACLEATRIEGLVEFYPGELGWALDRQLSVLERAGVLEQQGAVYTPREYAGHDRSGGQVSLTPAGVHIAVEVLRRYGVDVVCLPPTEEMTADDLASLVNDAGLSAEEWWRTVEDWVGSRPDRDRAFAELVDRLARDPLRLALAVGVSPAGLRDPLEPPLRALADHPTHPDSVAGSVALNWLFTNDLVDIGSIPPERVLDSMIDIFTIDDDDQGVVDLVMQGRSVREQLDLVGAVSGRDRPGTERFLDALGRLHPDKTVGKAARKELFRTRSRTGS
jgi:hypothetical protein